MGKTVTIRETEAQVFRGYLARATRDDAPSVLVLHEIFGVNAYIRDVTDGFAAAGFNALAPELYWREGSNIEIEAIDEGSVRRALELRTRLDEVDYIDDCATAAEFVRGVSGSAGSCGAVGYCLGGTLAYLLAVRGVIDGGVSYYGTDLHLAVAEASLLRASVLLHMPANDALCPPDAQRLIISRLDAVRPRLASDVDLHVYPDAGHAFTRPGTGYYNEASATLANQRTLAFLHKHLDSPRPSAVLG
jgi:carboxymethylenebutenolidase